MLTAEHVRARRRAGELFITAIGDKQRPQALHYAREYLNAAQGAVGKTRGDLEESWNEMPTAAKDVKLAAGLRKLVDDMCEFEVDQEIDPLKIRETVFELAAKIRGQGDFDREAILGNAAEALSLSPAAVAGNLYSDLRHAHRLLLAPELDPEELLRRYELGQAQAVLLRAAKLTVRVADRRASAYRELFRAIKFRRLLAEIYPDGDGYRIELDGPLSLFSSATKYGLALALLLPAIRGMEAWSLSAEIVWGKKRERLVFKQTGKREGTPTEAPLPDELERLLERWPTQKTPWVPERRAEIMSVPGVGVIAPDIAFHNQKTGEVIYFELLGYWSRDAVWRRLELVENGLKERVLFACSSKLRVSEKVFDEQVPGSLLVFKGTLSPKAVLEKLKLLEG